MFRLAWAVATYAGVLFLLGRWAWRYSTPDETARGAGDR